MNEFVLCADIARKRDFFAILAFQDNAQIKQGNRLLEAPDRIIHTYDIVLIEKYQGMGYEEMAERLAALSNHIRLRNNSDLVVDGTGVGDAAIELIRKQGLSPVPIIFSGGESYSEKYAAFGQVFKGTPSELSRIQTLKEIVVPKKDLVAAGSVLLQQKRIRLAPGRWKEEFEKQLAGFRGRVNEKTRNIKYEALTESVHDDLVVCYLMGAWWLRHRAAKNDIPEELSEKEETAGWNPLDYVM